MKVNELYKKQGFVVIKRVLTKEEVKSSSTLIKKNINEYKILGKEIVKFK